MKRYYTLNICLITLLLLSFIIMCTIYIIKQNYNIQMDNIQQILDDEQFDKYFSSEEEVYTFVDDGRQEIVYRSLCITCDDNDKFLFAKNSKLIVDSSSELCDKTIENCIVYNYDPFGLGNINKPKIMRSMKEE